MEIKKHRLSNFIQSNALLLVLILLIIIAILSCNIPSAPARLSTATTVISPVPLITATKPGDGTLSSEVASSTTALEPSSSTKTTAIWEGGTETAGIPIDLGTPQVSYWFTGEECACATFPAAAETSYGSGYLECRYAWSGEYIDDNALSFSVTHYRDQAELDQEFTEQVGWMYDSAEEDQSYIDAGSVQDNEQYIARNETNGFTYVTTGPGGGSSKTNTEIPMCGHGQGMIRVQNTFLIEIHLFACDLSADRQVYQTAIETLEDCALSSIEQVQSATPND